MAEFEYFATFDESISILRDLCQHGFEVVIDRLYNVPSAPRYTEVTDEVVQGLKDSYGGFYLAGSFTRHPIQFSYLNGGEAAGKYDVNLLDQGPVMQCSLAWINEVDGLPTLLWGDISYQSDAYLNPETKEWEPPSPELKAAYKKAVSIIKKHTAPYESGIKIHIAPEARRLLETGAARITYPGFVAPTPRSV